MGKHFVTVCVFCLLCATHTPCSSHVQYSKTEKRLDDGQISVVNNPNRLPVKKTVYEKITDRFSTTTWDTSAPAPDDNLTQHIVNSVNNNNNNIKNSLSLTNSKSKSKTKRDIHRPQKFDDALYIEKIFAIYGNGETMNYTGFERLVKSLTLDRLLWSNLNDSVNNSPGTVAANRPNNDSPTCMDHKDLLRAVSPETPMSNQNSSNSSATGDFDVSINSTALRRLCPVLIYQLVAQSSAERQGCIVVTPPTDSDNEENSVTNHTHNNMGLVWLYSTLSIIIISACGLLGVLVIPIMQQHFYQHLIQFLVALAVGTLAGDALLHLLPHAMMSHSHEHHDSSHDHGHDDFDDQHDKNIWRGFVAMMGLIFFFFMEKCLTLGAEFRKQRQQRKNKVPARVRVMRETDTVSTNSVGCKHKYSSYPYCYDVIATETQDDHHNRHQHSHNANSGGDAHNHTTTTILNDLDSDSEYLAKHGHPPETNQNLSKCTNTSKNIKCSESNKMLAENADTHTLQEFTAPKPEISESESYTVILRTHETKHHGHSHTHGHVHSAPKTLSSVAWMVVMGDGLHNFTDGMTIGAAFAGSLAGGFSTAVAVFCHELPHEIGDFAVLLKAGMTARQAVFYNMLSSILCMFGMVLGVTVGNNDTASSWMFASAAGMFLYIALVDMIPELTTSHSKEGGSLLQCGLQFAGLLSGLAIMLVIAVYEHDLKRLFDD